tara:strand:- start:476 stop:7219 length:6744 start_codon:yes stop_codon:yes gene_type:complete
MARQNINIGVEGNDGTGDSIRESFRKANENFTELYAVFGQGGQISFRSLSDVPDTLTANTVPQVNAAGDALEMKSLLGGTGITVTQSSSAITITNSSAGVSSDAVPSLGGPLNAANQGIANVNISQSAINALNTAHGTTFTIDDLVISKGYADARYLTSTGSPGAAGQIRVRSEPADASGYTFTIASFSNGNLNTSTNHGFTTTSNGIAYKYKSTGTDATGLTTGTTYYLRFVTATSLSIHSTLSEAQNNDDASRVKISASGGSGTQTMTDADYDSTLEGFWIKSEALPRESVVRRQGDSMTGALFLNDHPGSFAGAGQPNGKTDLQAVTKYYVDNSAYASPTNLFVSTKGDDAMANVPVGSEGRAWNYAYKSVAAAAAKAEEIIVTSPLTVGPYRQDITYGNGASKSQVVTSGVTSSSGYEEVKVLTDANLRFIREETISYLNVTYPNYLFDRVQCRSDLGKIANSIVLDMLDGTTANYHSRNAGLRYYSSASGQIARQSQRTETLAAITFAKALHGKVITNVMETTLYQGSFAVRTLGLSPTTLTINTGANPEYAHTYVSGGTVTFGGQTHNVSSATYDHINGIVSITTATPHGAVAGSIIQVANILWNCSLGNKIYPDVTVQTTDNTQVVDLVGQTAVAAKWDIISTIITGPTIAVAPQLIEGSTWSITISNGNNGYVDQNISSNQDLIPGKLVIGKTSGAVGRLVSITAGATNDTLEVELLEPLTFTVGEELEYGSKVSSRNITIHVESGTYNEHFPIRVSNGVSIKGDEFRRVIIQPVDGVSTSQWRSVYFYREPEFDSINLKTVSNPNATALLVANKEYLKDETVAWIDSQITGGSGIWSGFSYDKKKFEVDTGKVIDALVYDLKHGGNEKFWNQANTYYDGTSSNITGREAQTKAAFDQLSTIIRSYILINTAYSSLQSITTQTIDSTNGEAASITKTNTEFTFLGDVIANGLGQLPTLESSSYGYHYLTDHTNSASTAKNNKDMDCFLMNDATILRNITVKGHGGFMMVLDPEGSVLTKSPYAQTCTSFSQSINKKRFAGGMFIDGFVGNLRTKILSTNSAYSINVQSETGEGLRIKKPQVPCPFYVDGQRYQVNAVTNYDQANGSATLLLDPTSGGNNGYTLNTPYTITLQTSGNRSMLANDFTQVNDLGYGTVAVNTALSELVSQFTYYNEAAYYSGTGAEIRSLNGSNAYGNYGLVSTGSDPNEVPDLITLNDNMVQTARIYDDGGATFNHAVDQLYVYVYDVEYIPNAGSEIEIDHGGLIGTTRYEVTTIEQPTQPGSPPTGTRSNTVYKLNLATTGANTTSSTGLKATLSNLQKIMIRSSNTFEFDGVQSTTTRPSSALVFDEAETVYRTLSFTGTDSLGAALTATEKAIRFDSPYNYIKLVVDNTNAQLNTHAGAGGTTMGNTAGDDVIAIVTITSQSQIDRLNSGDMIFVWDGKTHQITGYTQRSGFGTIAITDVAGKDINTSGNVTGLHSTVVDTNSVVTLRAGLASAEGANITVNISTCRATGHDFLDIGTGGFNTSNYPNSTFGAPSQTKDQNKETDERDKGRVFYVSTDQDGFFRVGRFFTVDQGTGTVTFAASIALSNLDGIGFKRGVVVSEFSADDTMADNATDAVPVESAVRGYVNKRLGFNHAGNIQSNPIGPGVLARDGTTSMTGNLPAGGFKITNLSDPSNNQDAATKSYVDNLIAAGDTLLESTDLESNNVAGNQLIVTTGKFRIYTAVATGGNFTIGQTITGSNSTATGTLVDVQNVTRNGVNENLLTYTATANVFTTADIISAQSGTITAQAKDGPHHEFSTAIEEAVSDINVVTERTGTGTTFDLQIAPDSIINADVKSNAAIAQSKLNLNAATTRANATGITQNDLGVASFDSGIFNTTNGFVTIDNGALDFRKLINIADQTVLGRSVQDSTTGDVTEVTFQQVVQGGGGVQETVSTTGAANALVKTDASGNASMQGLKVDSYLIIDTSGTEVQFTTPGGAQFLTSSGTVTPTINIPGSVNIGNTGVTQGSFQTNSALAGESRLAVDWIHSSFIEAPGELDANSTGIGIGANTGYSAAGEISLVADGATVLKATVAGVEPGVDNTYMIGSATKRYNTIYSTVFSGTATQARYADLAENYLGDADYEVGTVLVFGGDKEVTQSSMHKDTRVAGVVSEHPAHLMNSDLQGDHVTAVALQGRTKVKVAGIIHKGDMLVTSSVPGLAAKGIDPSVGSVIGKALEDHLEPGHGVIEMVVGRV